MQQQQADLATQHAALQAEEEKLTLASQRLQAKVDAFRTRKETIKATYTAAEAQTKIGEAFSGISEEMGDVGLAVQRAEDKTQAMQARAGAIDELLASGALDDATGTAKDDITAELERMSSQGDVELELARLKGELGAGKAPEAIEGGGAGRRAGTAADRAAERRGGAAVIVRILGEGQYAVDDAHADLLNGLDSGLERAVEAGDEAAFRSALADLLAQVRTVGERLPDDSLEPSDAAAPRREQLARGGPGDAGRLERGPHPRLSRWPTPATAPTAA